MNGGSTASLYDRTNPAICAKCVFRDDFGGYDPSSQFCFDCWAGSEFENDPSVKNFGGIGRFIAG